MSRTGPIARPNEALHRVTDRLAHAAHLTVATLVNHQAQYPGGQDAHLGRSRGAVVELHTLSQRSQGTRAGGAPGHLGHVLLGHPVGGMGQQLGERTVVGQDQETLGGAVQPTDCEDAGFGAAPGT